MENSKTLYGRVSLAYGTKEELTRLNETYENKVPIFELDVEHGLVRMKMGNNATPYVDLPYVLEYTLTEKLYQMLINANKSGGVAILDENGILDPNILGNTTLSTNDIVILKSGNAKDATTLYNEVMSTNVTKE